MSMNLLERVGARFFPVQMAERFARQNRGNDVETIYNRVDRKIISTHPHILRRYSLKNYERLRELYLQTYQPDPLTQIGRVANSLFRK